MSTARSSATICSGSSHTISPTRSTKAGPCRRRFDAHPQNLQSLITNFNSTAAAFAAKSAALQNAVAELPKTLQVAIPAFNALNNAFPPLRAFARALIPGVKSTGPAIDASLPFITQLRLLVQPSELRGLTHDLAPTMPALAKLTQQTIPLMKNEVRPASSCAVGQIIPWSHLTINDPNFNASNGFPPHPTYQEIPELLPGIAGESRDFDANGPYFRIMGEGGTFAYSLSPGMFGTAISSLNGVQPIPPAGDARPPLQAERGLRDPTGDHDARTRRLAFRPRRSRRQPRPRQPAWRCRRRSTRR